jgi:glyoxylase-like metal-dependent hydrolase (beta-lactamase superfamily II)
LDHGELSPTGNQFDKLVDESMTWTLGKNIHCSVLATPGHTPACMSYRIGDAGFVGDTLFMVREFIPILVLVMLTLIIA